MSIILLSPTAEQFSGKIHLSIDSKGYTSKPAGAEIGAIRNRLSGKAAAAAIDIQTLASEIQNGKTIQGAILRDKQNENEDTDTRFAGQQLFNVDIDNDIKNENGDKVKSSTAIETPEQIQSIAAAAGLTPCYIAESFSSGKKDVNGAIIPKYHVGFAAAEPVKDVNQSRRILLNLLSVFKSADEACKDPARIIFGTGKTKKVFYNSAVNSLDTLLNCGKLPEEPEQPQFPSSAPAPRTSRSQSTAPKASGKTGHNSDFTKDLKENKTDPDRLLFMIDPNNITFEQWRRVVAAYKQFDNATIENFDTWNRQYTGSDNRKLKQDLKQYKGLGKGVDKMSLHFIAEEQNPAEYQNYMQELISIYKQPARASKKQASGAGSADPAGAVPEIIAGYAEPQPEQWAPIKDFDAEPEGQAFPLDTLPQILQNYVKAAAEYHSIYPEMCVLPLLSALSVCLQDKAQVKHPGTGHLEPLNLYTLTIADPGERKTSTLRTFTDPIDEYEKEYNRNHRQEIDEYNIQHQMLSNRLNSALTRTKPTDAATGNSNTDYAITLKRELTELEQDPKKALSLTHKDITPEALTEVLDVNDGNAAIIGDEATILKILCGMYSRNGSVNLEPFLNAYDGTPIKVDRKGSAPVYISNPHLTIGLMTQPSVFNRTFKNKDITGQGLLQRFIFAFPGTKAGSIPFTTPRIPTELALSYRDLIYSLLRKKPTTKPIESSKEAFKVFREYHDFLQQKIRRGGIFEEAHDYANKQVGKVLRIAAILHLCEHSEGESISGQTAMNAYRIGNWTENQAVKALGANLLTDTEKNARKLARKLKEDCIKQKVDPNKPLTKRDIERMCRTMNKYEIQDALSYLDDMNVLRYQEEKQSRGRPTMKVYINPELPTCDKI